MGVHAVMHHFMDFILNGEHVGRAAANRVGHVVVQVAIAQMAKGDGAHAGKACLQRGSRGGQEVGNARDRYRHIVFDIAAVALLCFAQRLVA